MIKYIKVDWPESQKFQDIDGNFPSNVYLADTYPLLIFVPEDLYEEVMCKLQFPKKYENTNLGTIVCYETRAIVNGEDIYWYDEDMIKKGSEVLIYNHSIDNRPQWIISKCTACSKGFPVIFKDSILCPGLNCEIIGVKSNG